MAKSTFFADFKKFIMRGNIMDMAVGVVVGSAFGKIVSSLVADIITPLITLATGGVNFSEKYIPLVVPEGVTAPDTATAAKELGISVLTYGNFIQTIIDFLIVSFCIFLVLRVMTKAKAVAEAKKIAEEEAKKAEDAKKAEEAAKALAEKQQRLEEAQLNQEKLLSEIRDLLKNR